VQAFILIAIEKQIVYFYKKIDNMKTSNLNILFLFLSVSALGILSSPVLEDDVLQNFINQN